MTERYPLKKPTETTKTITPKETEKKEDTTEEKKEEGKEGEKKKESQQDERSQAYFRITLNSAPPSEKEEEKKEEEEKPEEELGISLSESIFADTPPEENLNISLDESLLPTPPTPKNEGLQIPLSESIFDILKEEDQQKSEEKDTVRAAEGDSLVFDQRLGQIIGRPILSLSTRQHNYLEVVINDPDGEIFAQIKDFKEVKAQIGFSEGKMEDKFTGVLSWIGRKLPDGTIIKAMDLGSNTSSTGLVESNTNKKITPEEIKEVLDTFGKDIGELEFGKPVQLKTALNSFPLSGPLLYSLEEASNNTNVFTQGNNNQGGFISNPSTLNASLQPNPDSLTIPRSNASKSDKQKLKEANASLKAISSINSVNNQPTSLLQSTIGQNTDGKINDANDLKIDKAGNINFSDSWMSALTADASKKGQVITVNEKGETSVASVGQGRETGLTIDYNENRAVFKYAPKVLLRTAFNNRSGFGSISISGWDVRNKTERGATLTVPDNSGGVSVANVPDWGTIKMSDPIFEGCIYTWGDATRNGSRVPKSKEHMANIVSIAQVIQGLTDQTVGKGKKWTITSWYRLHVVRAKNSQHLVGRAVDAYFPNYQDLYKKLDTTWTGGLALGGRSGNFIHIDNRPYNGGKLPRWNY